MPTASMQFVLPIPLRTFFLLTCFLLSSFSLWAQAPMKQWAKRFGGRGDDRLYALEPTPDGGYLLGGESNSEPSKDKTQTSKGSTDYWVVKIDANGNKLWDRTLGGSAGDYLRVLRLTPDGGYLLGGYSASGATGDKTQASRGSYDYWIVKLDAQGNTLWDRAFGGFSGEILSTLQLTKDGGYILGGASTSGASGDKTQSNKGASEEDYWIIKLDASGNKQWDKTFGGNDRDYLVALQQTQDGSYIVGGSSLSGISGDKAQASRGISDYWVLKLDANGNKLWDKTFGGNSYDNLTDLQLTPDGGYILGGESYSTLSGDMTQVNHGSTDFWLVKLDTNGTKQWDRTYGGISNEEMGAFLQTKNGGYLLAGSSGSGISGDKTQASNGPGYFDYWLIQLDASGQKLWDLSFGGTANDFLYAVQPTADGSYILGGYSISSMPDSQGFDDYWVIKLSNSTVTATSTPSKDSSFSLYPNPAQSAFTLRLPPALVRTSLRLSLLDAAGRIVSTQPVFATDTDLPVPVGQHSPGLYLLRIEGANGLVATQRIVLQ